MVVNSLYPDTTNGTAIYGDQLGWCQGGLSGAAYGSPVECLGNDRKLSTSMIFVWPIFLVTSTCCPFSSVGGALADHSASAQVKRLRRRTSETSNLQDLGPWGCLDLLNCNTPGFDLQKRSKFRSPRFVEGRRVGHRGLWT